MSDFVAGIMLGAGIVGVCLDQQRPWVSAICVAVVLIVIPRLTKFFGDLP